MPELKQFTLPGTENLGEATTASPSSIINPIDNKPIEPNKPIGPNKLVQDIVDNNFKAPEKKEEDNDIVSQLKQQGGSVLVVVDNNQEDRVRLNDFGYVTVKNPGFTSGTVAILTDGEALTQYQGLDKTEDYLKKETEFLNGFNSAKEKFERARKVQELAKKGNEDFVEQKDFVSFLDLLCSSVKASFNAALSKTGTLTGQFSPIEYLPEQWDALAEQGKKYYYQTALGHYMVNRDAHDYILEYQIDPEKAVDHLLNDTSLSELQREYYAYEMITGDVYRTDGSYTSDFANETIIHTLRNMGESMDWLANPVKATVMWLDAQNGKTWSFQNGDYNFEDMSLWDTLKTCYAAAWENEGRIAYDYNTGFVPFDFALEVLADPETIGKILQKGLGEGVLTSIAKDLDVELPKLDIHDLSSLRDRVNIRKQLLEGNYDVVAKYFPESAREGVLKILNDSAEYSKYLAAKKTLGVLDDFLTGKQAIDDLMLKGIFGPMSLTYRILKTSVQFVAGKAFNFKAVAFNDTIAEMQRYHNHGIELAQAPEMIDRANVKLMTLMNNEYPVDFLTKDEKYALIFDLYKKSISSDENDQITIELLKRYELEDTPLMKALNNSYKEFKDLHITLATMEVPHSITEGHSDLIKLIDDEDVSIAVNDLKLPIGAVNTAQSFKINSVIEADTLLDNKHYMDIIKTADSDTTTAQTMFARSTMLTEGVEPSRVRRQENKVLNRILSTRSQTKNYMFLSDALAKESVNFNSSERKWLKDYLFNGGFINKTRRISYEFDYLDEAGFLHESRSLAQDWVKGAFHLEDMYEGTKSVNFEEFGDVYNFDVLADIHKSLYNIPSYKETPVFYTIRWTGNNIYLDLKTPTDTLSVVLDRVEECVEECSKLDEFVRHLPQNSKFYGFNTHASGYDTDSIVRSILYKNHSVSRTAFMSGVDMADRIRIDRGLPIISESQMLEAQEYIYTCMANTRSDNVHSLGYFKSKFALTPPTYDEWNAISDQIKRISPKKVVVSGGYYVDTSLRDAAGNLVSKDTYIDDTSMDDIFRVSAGDIEAPDYYVKDTVVDDMLKVSAEDIDEPLLDASGNYMIDLDHYIPDTTIDDILDARPDVIEALTKEIPEADLELPTTKEMSIIGEDILDADNFNYPQIEYNAKVANAFGFHDRKMYYARLDICADALLEEVEWTPQQMLMLKSLGPAIGVFPLISDADEMSKWFNASTSTQIEQDILVDYIRRLQRKLGETNIMKVCQDYQAGNISKDVAVAGVRSQLHEYMRPYIIFKDDKTIYKAETKVEHVAGNDRLARLRTPDADYSSTISTGYDVHTRVYPEGIKEITVPEYHRPKIAPKKSAHASEGLNIPKAQVADKHKNFILRNYDTPTKRAATAEALAQALLDKNLFRAMLHDPETFKDVYEFAKQYGVTIPDDILYMRGSKRWRADAVHMEDGTWKLANISLTLGQGRDIWGHEIDKKYKTLIYPLADDYQIKLAEKVMKKYNLVYKDLEFGGTLLQGAPDLTEYITKDLEELYTKTAPDTVAEELEALMRSHGIISAVDYSDDLDEFGAVPEEVENTLYEMYEDERIKRIRSRRVYLPRSGSEYTENVILTREYPIDAFPDRKIIQNLSDRESIVEIKGKQYIETVSTESYVDRFGKVSPIKTYSKVENTESKSYVKRTKNIYPTKEYVPKTYTFEPMDRTVEEDDIYNLLKSTSSEYEMRSAEISAAYKSIYHDAGFDAVTDFDYAGVELNEMTNGKIMLSKLWDQAVGEKWMPTVDVTRYDKAYIRYHYEIARDLENVESNLKIECNMIPDKIVNRAFNAFKSKVEGTKSSFIDPKVLASWADVKCETKTQKLAYILTAKRTFGVFVNDSWKGGLDKYIFKANGTMQYIGSSESTDMRVWDKLFDTDFLFKSGKRFYNPYEIAPGVFGSANNAWARTAQLSEQIYHINNGMNVLARKEQLLNGKYDYKTLALDRGYDIFSKLRSYEFIGSLDERNVGTWFEQLSGNYKPGMYRPPSTAKVHEVDRAVLKSIISLNDDEFDELMYWANDHMIFSKSVDPFDLGYLRKKLSELGDNYEVKELDDVFTVVRKERVYDTEVRYTKNGEVTRDIMPYNYNEQHLKMYDANHDLYAAFHGTSMFEGLHLLDPDKFNPQFSLSSHVGNTAALRDAVYSKYFPDEVIKDNGAYWFGSYIGPVQELTATGAHVSNDMYVNMVNGYSRALRKELSYTDQIKVAFQTRPDATVSIADAKRFGKSWEDLQEEGYMAVRFMKDKYGRVYLDKCLPTDKYAKIFSFEEYHNMQDICKNYSKEVISELPLKKQKALEIWTALRSLYIKMYLFTNPATWIRNWVDSTTKATITEGADHLEYLIAARDILGSYTEMHKAIEEFAKAEDIPDFNTAVNVYYNKHKDLPINKRTFRQIETFDKSSLSLGLLNAETDYQFLTKFGAWADGVGSSGLMKFNADMFEQCESLNRTAILLHEFDKGSGTNAALHAIDKSQFDYSKLGTFRGASTIFPFIDFRLKNYDYWFGMDYNSMAVGNIAQMYVNRIGSTEYEREWWSEEAMTYRAWIDTLPKDGDYEKAAYSYDSWKDYRGSDSFAAFENGWVMIGNNLYLKLGLSFTDALTGLPAYFAPIYDSFRNGEWFDAGQNIITNVFGPLKSVVGIMRNEIEKPGGEDLSLTSWLTKYGYDVTSMVPIVGTLLYRMMTATRNFMAGERFDLTPTEKFLLTGCSDLIALQKQATDRYLNTYLQREVGFNWYDLTEEERDEYRYVVGVSYVPTWVLKDPAEYVDVWGRMRAMGFTNEELSTIMSDAKGFWITPEDGKVHNYTLAQGEWAKEMLRQNEMFKADNEWATLPEYQTPQSRLWEIKLGTLMIKSEKVYEKLREDLVAMGWTNTEAEMWLKECAVPTWEIKPYEKREEVDGNNNGYHSLSGVYEAPTQSERHPNQWRLSDSLGLRRQQTVRQTTLQKTREDKVSTAKWHKRQRDIYKDNYAKYGTSRMVMNQNLKNYSNRSVTELHRSEQIIRYNQIHRHTRWFA